MSKSISEKLEMCNVEPIMWYPSTWNPGARYRVPIHSTCFGILNYNAVQLLLSCYSNTTGHLWSVHFKYRHGNRNLIFRELPGITIMFVCSYLLKYTLHPQRFHFLKRVANTLQNVSYDNMKLYICVLILNFYSFNETTLFNIFQIWNHQTWEKSSF